MEKKGILRKEFLGMVIAVISLVLLAGLLYDVYASVRDSRELELAKESLNKLISEINLGKEKVDIYNPSNWNLGTWPHKFEVRIGEYPSGAPKTKLTEDKPQTCHNLVFQKCICLCEENNPDSCDKNGICLDNSQGFEIVGDFATEENIKIINPPVTLNINYTNKKISRS